MAALVHQRNGHSRPVAPVLWDPWRLLQQPLHLDRGARIHETSDSVSVSVDMPGLDAEDIDITLDRGTLEIVGRRDERTYAFFATVGNAIDADRISTQLEHGVLTIHAPKLAAGSPRRIAVNTKQRSETKPAQPWWRRWFGKK